MLEKETVRVVVVVEIEIDKDGVETINNSYSNGDGIGEYIGDELGLDIRVRKVLDMQEFDTEA